MEKILILYPHGLGDCILLTPALRNLNQQLGQKCSIAILERFRSSEIFKNCPYIDKIYYTKDAWHDFDNERVGFQTLYDEMSSFALEAGYDKCVMPMHNNFRSKIMVNLESLGIKNPTNYKTEIFTTQEDKERASEIISSIVGDEKFGFVQTVSGHNVKSLPDNFGRKWLKENKGLEKAIEIGKEIKPNEYSINVQFEILRKATSVCLPDSVFYHARCAMELPVDFVYFARGISVYERVKPLHWVIQNPVFEL